MEKAIIAFFAIGFIITGILAYPVFTKWRQNRLKSRPLPSIWNAIIENNLPILTDYLLQNADDFRDRFKCYWQKNNLL